MALNIRQIAEIAGVAPSTISRATNPETRHMLSEKTLKKIDALVKKHGYVPNIAARQLNKPGAKIIGVILPYYEGMFYHSYYTHVLAGIADALIHTDYSFKLILLKPQEEKWNWYDFQAGEGVEGIIITHWFLFFSSQFLADDSALPHVVINDYDENIEAYFVCEDGKQGGRLAAEHLYEMGHRNVAVITGSEYSRDSYWRLKGFIDFWNEKDIFLPEENIVEGNFAGGDKVIDTVDSILDLEKRPTAIFACNDTIAFIANQRLKEKGISCPEDISLIGYDDSPSCEYAEPSLSSIRPPLHDLAVRSVNILIDHLTNKGKSNILVGNDQVPVELIKRQSVKKI